MAAILGAIAITAGSPAHASLVADGITYTLYESTVSSTEDQFTLDIAGINGSTDTEGGRYGVQSFAFTQPSSGVTAGSLSGFTFSMGGLNSSGCNMHGNFFCFTNNTTPTAPPLGTDSSLQFTFTVTTASANGFAGYDPMFKINWDGTKNNYDLVSKTLTPNAVPLPAALPLLLSGIAGLGFMRRRKAA